MNRKTTPVSLGLASLCTFCLSYLVDCWTVDFFLKIGLHAHSQVPCVGVFVFSANRATVASGSSELESAKIN